MYILDELHTDTSTNIFNESSQSKLTFIAKIISTIPCQTVLDIVTAFNDALHLVNILIQHIVVFNRINNRIQ